MDLEQMKTRDEIARLEDTLQVDDWKPVRLLSGSVPRRLLRSFVYTATGELWPIDDWSQDPSWCESFNWPVVLFPSEAVSDADFVDFFTRDDCANLKMKMSLLPVTEEGI